MTVIKYLHIVIPVFAAYLFNIYILIGLYYLQKVLVHFLYDINYNG